MKLTSILPLALALCIACNNVKKSDPIENEPIVETDSTVVENQPIVPILKTEIEEPPRGGQLLVEDGEMVFIIENEYSFISDPYDFSLSNDAIEALLGEGAKTKVEQFEGGEDYRAYTYSTTTYEDTEISYYSYPGKHSASIRTPLLPLKNGIKIGMSKKDFLIAMKYENSDTSKANIYRLIDDYGAMDFSFRADTLYYIYARYEEGD